MISGGVQKKDKMMLDEEKLQNELAKDICNSLTEFVEVCQRIGMTDTEINQKLEDGYRDQS